ncbi:MAG: zinc metallopeptidase [Rhodobacteraceae bacterium]|nr:zinc metallopeptidase [Paracoccaceae bacterium]
MPTDLLFWLLVLPGMALGAYAQSRIRYNVSKYSRIPALSGATGAQVARYLLDARGLNRVSVEPTDGVLSDHYDPRSQTLRLSQGIWSASPRMRPDMPFRMRTTTSLSNCAA